MTSGLMVALFAWLLAFANGANDNSKGVATLFGIGMVRLRWAIWFAAGTTLLGSLAAIWIGAELAAKFKGGGIVHLDVHQATAFAPAIALAAAVTILLATRLGMPVSTTHAMDGSIVGVGVVSNGLIWEGVWSSFLLPLLVAPFIAAGLAAGVYVVMRWRRIILGFMHQTCI